LAKWIVRLSFAVSWVTPWVFCVQADTGWEWFICAVLIVLVPFTFIPVLEELDG
jgi:hypothetical protein